MAKCRKNRDWELLVHGGVSRGNVAVREHIVRDTRQQMERRGPGEADSSDTPKREGGRSPASDE